MKKYISIIILLFYSNYLQASDNLKFYIEKALKNNLQLNAERKICLQNRTKIFQEVNFYLVLLYQGIKPV